MGHLIIYFLIEFKSISNMDVYHLSFKNSNLLLKLKNAIYFNSTITTYT